MTSRMLAVDPRLGRRSRFDESARVKLIEPPAPGMVPDLLLKLDEPFLTVTWTAAPPQLAGMSLSVTLATLLPERLWITLMPLVVQRVTLTLTAPRLRLDRASEAAAAIEIATAAVQVRRPTSAPFWKVPERGGGR